MKVGIIGGSGLYEIDGFLSKDEITIHTDYGQPSDSYRIFEYKGHEFYFLNRHGRSHSIPPHNVNYRANIEGFYKLGVERIFSFTAVGGIKDVKPGDIVVPDNGIDKTEGRKGTFFDDGLICHIDFTEPFCPELRDVLLSAAEKGGVSAKDGGVYVTTNGPRLETAAEINYYKMIGCDYVGMTLFPECVLAREKELCYANVSIITNYAAGATNEKLTADEVVEMMKASTEKIKSLVSNIPEFLKYDRKCGCPSALNGQKISKEKDD